MKQILTITKCAAIVSLTIFLMGCSTLRDNPTIKLDTKSEVDAFIANTDATRTLSYFTVDSKGNVRMLSGVPPEAILTSVTEIMGKLKYKELDAEATAKFSENLTILGRRTVAVSVLMNALYRLHEMGINGTVNEDIKQMFAKVIDATVTIANAEEQTARAQASSELNKLLQTISSLQVDSATKERMSIKATGITDGNDKK